MRVCVCICLCVYTYVSVSMLHAHVRACVHVGVLMDMHAKPLQL